MSTKKLIKLIKLLTKLYPQLEIKERESPKKVTIQVTQEDIDQGKKESCPLASAVESHKEATKIRLSEVVIWPISTDLLPEQASRLLRKHKYICYRWDKHTQPEQSTNVYNLTEKSDDITIVCLYSEVVQGE